MSKISSSFLATALALGSSAVFAQGIPGTAALVQDSTIVVSGNKAKNITVGGSNTQGSVAAGKLGLGAAAGFEHDSSGGIANVNSINIEGATIKNSTIAVMDNEADGVTVTGGGTANVNSINIK